MSKLTDAEIARMHPETLALSYGFDPWLSEGAVKPPVFLTSTFAFKHAADGKQFFAWAHGEGTPPPRREMGLIYSRINNPNLEIFEDRVAIWEGMKDACSFSSGMAAIATTLLATHHPGDEMIVCAPVYGGTDSLIHHFLKRLGIAAHFVPAGAGAPPAAGPPLTPRTPPLFLHSPAHPLHLHREPGESQQPADRHRPHEGARAAPRPRGPRPDRRPHPRDRRQQDGGPRVRPAREGRRGHRAVFRHEIHRGPLGRGRRRRAGQRRRALNRHRPASRAPWGDAQSVHGLAAHALPRDPQDPGRAPAAQCGACGRVSGLAPKGAQGPVHRALDGGRPRIRDLPETTHGARIADLVLHTRRGEGGVRVS